MRFFNWFKNKEQKKSVKEILPELHVGNIVRLKYKNPKEMGFTNEHTITFTRFNPNELSDRVVNGTISKLWYEPFPLNTQLIEITIVKEHGKIRKMVFLEEELEWIERL